MSHLHLVGREPKKPKRKRWQRTPLLSPEESRLFRQAVRNVKDHGFATWGCLASAMRVTRVALAHMLDGRHAVSGDMIVRVMRATGLTLDDLLGAPKLVRRAS